MKRAESLKRIILLAVSAISLLVQVMLYMVIWQRNYETHMKVILWFKGQLLLVAFYGVLLFFFYVMYGGLKIGYLKSSEVSFSQMLGTFCVNILTYAQISLLSQDLVGASPLIALTIMQFIWIGIWGFLADLLYKGIFPPKKMLLIHGKRPVDDILNKFKTRKDKFEICKCMNILEGIDEVMTETLMGYDAIIIWDIPTIDRNKILKFCFGQSIRVYSMPKITDILVKGSSQIHLFDTPILLTREYVLTLEQRAMKRIIDLVCAFILIIITSPIMLVTAIVIKCYDGGSILYKQIRCTSDGKKFSILKFRSMKVDAEKDGVARLAAKGDDRITPIGKIIRMIRVDELPQLFNIITGDMSFIGPRPERPELIAQYIEEMPEFLFRTKVKAGLAGYAQIYGKYNTTPYDKLKLDLFYIENYSIWMDLKLMMLTLKILLKPESTEGVAKDQLTALKDKNDVDM